MKHNRISLKQHIEDKITGQLNQLFELGRIRQQFEIMNPATVTEEYVENGIDHNEHSKNQLIDIILDEIISLSQDKFLEKKFE